MALPKSYMVSTVQNQSLVRGQVVAMRTEPDGIGQTIDVSVVESKSVDDLPNFATSIVGRTIPFYLSVNDLVLRPGDRIEAKATYRGGPAGGRYSFLPDDIKRI